MSEQLVADLREDEGEVLHVYPDSKGFWTLGVGILVDARKGGGITQEESTYLLNSRIAAATKALNAAFSWFAGLDPVRRDALVNMTFQLGIDGVVGFRKAMHLLAQGRWVDAEVELKDSKWLKSDSPARAARVIKQLVTGKPRHGP